MYTYVYTLAHTHTHIYIYNPPFLLSFCSTYVYVVPDCRKESLQGLYIVSFTTSILWIGVLSFVMVDFASRYETKNLQSAASHKRSFVHL
jgi:hypothetical protein